MVELHLFGWVSVQASACRGPAQASQRDEKSREPIKQGQKSEKIGLFLFGHNHLTPTVPSVKKERKENFSQRSWRGKREPLRTVLAAVLLHLSFWVFLKRQASIFDPHW